MKIDDLIKERDALTARIEQLKNDPFHPGSIFYFAKIRNGAVVIFRIEILEYSERNSNSRSFKQYIGHDKQCINIAAFSKKEDSYFLNWTDNREKIFSTEKEALRNLHCSLTNELSLVVKTLQELNHK